MRDCSMLAFNRRSFGVSARAIFGWVFFSRVAKIASALAVAGIFVSGLTQYAQERLSPTSASMPPRELTFAELAKDPSVFDKQRIRLTAFINFAFEDFRMWDPECPENKTDFALWLTYGGTANSGAVYCCPGEATPRTGALSFPLVEDMKYRDFRSLLNKERDTVVRATVVGTLLARPKAGTPAERLFGGGYGHMGCCSLLVIEQIASFEPHVRKDLDYSATSGFYAGNKLRCRGWSEHWELTDVNGDTFLGPSYGGGQSLIREQGAADSGERSWAFADPARVALEAVRRGHGDSVKSLKRVQALQGLIVFEGRHNKSVTTVVVARPYWLSYYAKSSKVAWVVTAMKTTSCSE